MIRKNFDKLAKYVKNNKIKSVFILLFSIIIINMNWFLFFSIVAIYALIKLLKNKKLIKEISEENNRDKPKKTLKEKSSLIIISSFVFIAFIVSATTINNSPGEKKNIQEVNQNVLLNSDSEEGQIKNIVYGQLKGKNNMGQPYIRKIDVVKQIDGGWGVFVEYNADDNFTTSMRKGGIETKMSEIYTALYTSNKDIRSSSVSAYFPVQDEYGNERSDVVYKSILEKPEAEKINWNTDSATLQVRIIPGVWTTSILHPEFHLK